jgi:formate/nitrite transporter FocA (FNT family)
MGLITLLFLLAFTVLYLSKSLEKKPELLAQAAEKIDAYINDIALWGVCYGFIVALLTILMNYNGADFLVRFFANIWVVIMALPYVFERGVDKFREKMNSAIIEESRKMISWISRKEKYVGYAGAVLSVLLFAVVFR